MSLPNPSLWHLTAASGPLARRFVADETARVPLAALAHGTTLAVPREQLLGATVALRTSTQLATSLALLELDGVAKRIVLCTPDLSDDNLVHAIATSGVTALVSDRPGPHLGVPHIASIGVTPSDAPRAAACETEWALFTSGTTGPPKMALHTLATLTGAIARVTGAAGDAVWSTFYDIRRYGGLQILLRALIGGGSMVLSGADEQVGDFLGRAADARITFLSGTPTHWRRALLSPAAAAISPPDVRLSGEVADQPILDKLRAAYPNARICHAFASTEAGVAFDVADGLAGFPADWVGQTRNGVDLKVSDGTLRIRSPRTARRYLHDAPLMDADGFVDTKDLVELRGDRYHFAGRRDGVINVGGLKVHPEEVEAIVNRHPMVEMSLVRSKRSPIIGAVVVVDVVLIPGDADSRTVTADIMQSCRDNLAAFKVPAAIRVVPSLTVTPAGKLLRTHA